MPLRLGDEDFDAVEEAEETFGTVAVADQRVEGREHTDAGGRLGRIEERRQPIGESEGVARLAIDSLQREFLQFVAVSGNPGLGLIGGDDVEEGGDFARGGKAEAGKCCPAGPVDKGLVVDFGRVMFAGITRSARS